MNYKSVFLYLCVSVVGIFSAYSFLPGDRADAIITKTATALPLSPGEAPAEAMPEAASPIRILGTEVVGQLTGNHSPNDTARRWDIHGTDLGHMFWHKDMLYMVFGDTYGIGGRRGSNWRSNTMARIADPDPRNGLPFEGMITGPDKAAKELLGSLKIPGIERTVIPTYAVSIDGRMYLHYMSVRMWGTSSNWMVRHSGLAVSDDDGQTWTKSRAARWPRGTGFEQVAFVMHEGMLYTFGIPEGRFGGVRLRRVAPERVLDPVAYTYWDGSAWVANPAVSVQVVPAPIGEFSVAWSEPHRAWMMMYLDPNRESVMLRSAATLVGPWSVPQVVATAKDYPGLYAPYIVPGSEIGSEIYFTLSRWDPIYNVFLMKTSLVAPDSEVVSGE